MPAKKIQRITNTRRRTAEEAADDRRLLDLVEQDKDEIIADGQRVLAEKRRRQAADQGTVTLGQKVRAARESRGLSQADLASRAHVGQDYLSNLEQDQREPSLSIAARIARELGIPLDELANAVPQ